MHFLSLISHAEWWLRLASLIPGLITIYFTFRIGCRLSGSPDEASAKSGRLVGLIAGLLLATSQFHVFYSQELRPYSLATMFATLSMYYFFEIVKFNRNTKYYILYTVLGMYSVYTFPFLILTQLVIVLIFYRKLLYSFIVYHLSFIVIFSLPWLPSFLAQFSAGMGVTQSLPLWSTAVSPPPIKALALIAPKFIFGKLDLPDYLPALVPLTIIILTLGYIVWLGRRSRSFWLLSLWLSLPILLGFIVSLKVPVLEPKRFLFCLPAFYLLLANGLNRTKKPLPMIIAILILNFATLIVYWVNPIYQREPWKQAIAEIEAKITPQSVVLFPWDGPYAPWVWYSTKNPALVVMDKLPVTINFLDPKLKAISLNTDRLFYFEYLESISDPGRLIQSELMSRAWQETGFFQYPQIGKVKIFSRAPVYANARL